MLLIYIFQLKLDKVSYYVITLFRTYYTDHVILRFLNCNGINTCDEWMLIETID